MARPITHSQQDIENLVAKTRAELEQLNKNKKHRATELRVTIPFGKDDRVAEVVFSQIAWVKMHELVKQFSTEVQWHGTVERLSENSFFVKDILIFPHEATNASVISDQEEYMAWLDNLDDETFKSVRFHGHSHPTFGVSPSSVDDTYQQGIINGFGRPTPEDDYFYIFLIQNKKGDMNCQIYDLTNNAYYDTDEVTIDVSLGDTDFLSSFVAEAKSIVTEPVRTVGFHHNGHKHNHHKNKGHKSIEDHADSLYDSMFGYGTRSFE